MASLGGLRGKSRDVPSDVNGFWTNESFHRLCVVGAVSRRSCTSA
jgi:hypothetical protein